MSFKVLWLFVKVFSAKFGDVASVGITSEQSAKFSPRKSYFPPIRESFLLRKFPAIW